MKVYYTTGQESTDENIIVKNIPLSEAGFFSVQLDLEERVSQLCFEPVEGCACVVAGLQAFADGKLLEGVFSSNGIFAEGVYIFDTTQPQIHIDLTGQPGGRLELRGNVYASLHDNQRLRAQNRELEEQNAQLLQAGRAAEARFKDNRDFLDAEVQKAKRKITTLRFQNEQSSARLVALEEEYAQLEARYEDISQAFFWRATKPLRGLVELFRKKDQQPAGTQAQSRYLYSVDGFEIKGQTVFIRGWVFDPDKRLEAASIVVQCGTQQYVLDAATRLQREDVTSAFDSPFAKDAGFTCAFFARNAPSFLVYLSCGVGEEREDILLQSVQMPDAEVSGPPTFENVSMTNVPVEEFGSFAQERWRAGRAPEYDSRLYQTTIDLIVPVYNGYEYLRRLFETIPNTKMQYRVFVIDDCSPDERVWPFLEQRQRGDSRIVLLRNEQNLGFVQTVNTGFAHTENPVAILNTDIELPDNWLERLMAPILLRDDVASSTPFTNCGTLCSFPAIGQDCDLFAGLTCGEIDAVFSQMSPSYTVLPTGVGFCMGISAAALKAVGPFDAETFSKGYGEENDWCQRAIKLGWKNVQVENLFVWHKHGGSFPSAEKQALLDKNAAALLAKHPHYNKDVAEFFSIDPAKGYRSLAIIELLARHRAGMTHLVFSHDWGGGANSYLQQRVEKWLAAEDAVILVQYSMPQSTYYVTVQYQEAAASFRLASLPALDEVLALLPPSEILVNELVGYPDIENVLAYIPQVEKQFQCPLVFLLHDYYCICPTINLMQPDGTCCCRQDTVHCKDCLEGNPVTRYPQGTTIKQWRKTWGGFLQQCTEVISFSDASRRILENVYPELRNVQMIPHQVNAMPRLAYPKATKTINIGLIGALDDIKGLEILQKMLVLTADMEDVQFVLVGYTGAKIDRRNFRQTGPYTLGELPRLMVENDIDVVFISSVWPETFSYTSAEVVQMGLPIASFNLGAQAEHVAGANGLLIEEISAESAVAQLVPYARRMAQKRPEPAYKGRVLFVVEYESFSSRYRVDHFREQLLFHGVGSEQVLLKSIGAMQAERYTTIVVYRCPFGPELAAFLEEAKSRGIQVCYDIDDLIFVYDNIKDLDFVAGAGKELQAYDEYAENLNAAMGMGDAFITSTNCLAGEIERYMHRPVVVNRNVASMEMLVMSLRARPRPADGRVVLGYFSGTPTHDADFTLILPALLRVMERYENVYLRVVGVVSIPPALKGFSGRILTSPFVDWRDLPQLIASVDINLMPLEDTIFHTCKSENKWMEAALVKVPTVLSENAEMAGVVADGVTGCLCKNAAGFEAAISALVENPDKRAEIAQNAHERVLAHYLTQNTGDAAVRLVMGG